LRWRRLSESLLERTSLSNFRRRVWLPALTKANLSEIHFHDLRHTGNILTATAGASLRELMPRMGHASTRAALVYLHDTDEWQRAIVTVISDLAQPELGQPNAPSEGSPKNATGT
jgi:integrase